MGTSSLTCAQVNGTPDGEACVLGPNAAMPETTEESTTGTYTVSGTGVTVIDSESGPDDMPKANPYCVNGDSLIVRVVDNDDGTTIVYQARRK